MEGQGIEDAVGNGEDKHDVEPEEEDEHEKEEHEEGDGDDDEDEAEVLGSDDEGDEAVASLRSASIGTSVVPTLAVRRRPQLVPSEGKGELQRAVAERRRDRNTGNED